MAHFVRIYTALASVSIAALLWWTEVMERREFEAWAAEARTTATYCGGWVRPICIVLAVGIAVGCVFLRAEKDGPRE